METNWFKFTPFVEFAVSSSMGESTGFAPFEMIYGSTPTSPADYFPGLSKAPAAQEFISNASHSFALAKSRIAKTQEWQKHYYDCKHQRIELNAGD